MARRYLVDPLPEPGSATLPQSVGHHLATVLRVRPGDAVRLFDGRGGECEARIAAVDRGQVVVDAQPAVAVQREPDVHLHLAVALPKGPRADWLFEHGTEVGVGTFHPLLTRRSSTRDRTGRISRWQRIVAAASGQCDRSRVPEVREPRSLLDLLADPSLPDERYLAAAAGDPLDRANQGSAILLVGPEGGFTDDEVAAAHAAGFHPRNLGPLTLRTETAALAGAVLLLRTHGTCRTPSSAKL